MMVFAVTVILAAMLGTGAVLFFFNPSINQYHFYPVCLFHQVTGLYCPGCGATRSLYALLHGNVAAALHDNALIIVTLAICLGWLARLTFKKIRGEAIAFHLPPKFLYTFLVVAIVFGVLRNLPAFHSLSP